MFICYCLPPSIDCRGQGSLLCSLINPKHPKQCLTHRSDQYMCRMNKWLSVFHCWSLAPHPSRVYPNWEEGGGERGRKTHNIKFVNPKADVTHREPVFPIDIGSPWNSGLTGQPTCRLHHVRIERTTSKVRASEPSEIPLHRG